MDSNFSRPDPDELLKQVQADEQARQRGKLKIFLGYAAGVGKTYAMLEAAHQRKAQGIDVAVGYIETHKRAETEELVEGLEVLPRKRVEYHNVALPEMGVDASLNQAEILTSLIAEEMSLGDMMTLLKLRRGKYSLVEEKIFPGALAVNKAIRDLPLPQNCVIAGIIRHGEIVMPRGVTALEEADEVLAIVDEPAREILAKLLSRP